MKKNDKIPEGNPFKVPDNYFEEVNRKIISSTVEKEVRFKKYGLYLKLRPLIAAAASVALLLILSYAGIKLFSPGNKTLSLSSIPIEEYTEAILNEIDVLTLEENALLLEVSWEEPQTEKEDIIDYLLIENIDINEIQDQL
jgi:hypothetical protein